MLQSGFRYCATYESEQGERLGDVLLELDFVPALRCAEFEWEIVHDAAPGGRSAHPVIEPIWSPEGQPPYVKGVRVRQLESGIAPVEFPFSYFSDAVVAGSSRLVESGAMTAGQQFEYKVFAIADERPTESPAVQIEAVDDVPSIETAPIAPLLARAGADAAVAANGQRMPIFFPQRVLDEATELAERSGDIETGGVLVGKLCRDEGGALFTSVTAQIPAQHTTGTRESLRFTPETWASVDAAIRLRDMGEIPLGWWHHHGFFCRNCPPERRALCPFSTPVFSAADRALHREIYQKAWSIALLLSFFDEERPSYDVFGWDKGQIRPTEFFTLPEENGNTGEK